ncbi:hypothetical protein [Tsukamurella pseudospumae]|uniref:hypothetical protein n=1 Tax=Tsukamurella pseudospumae TaxID=239498 RepID=UPI0012E7B29D|nr:hypothetical protein [Tsukamurella pseudospumae]
MTLMDRAGETEHMSARSAGRVAKRTMFNLGLGSLIDLRGAVTYRAARRVVPPRRPKSMGTISADVTRLMSTTIRTSSR